MWAQMTPAELKSARRMLGMSAARFARLVGIKGGRTVYRWENPAGTVPERVAILVRIALERPDALEMMGKTDG